MIPFIRTYSGSRVYLLKPKAASLKIEDIAHALSQIVRFTGHCSGPYTVAEHCCHCCDMAPREHKLSALLHDAQETWVGDCATPLKVCMAQYQEIEDRFERLVARKWHLPNPHPAVVKEIDRRMLVTEMKWLLTKGDYKSYPWTPYDLTIRVWSHAKAKREFMKRFHRLYR